MCGRYALTSSADILTALFGLGACAPLVPRFNIAPTQDAAFVRAGADGVRRLDLLRWGLVPPWAPDSTAGARLINARSETAHSKPAFREALAARRGLVPIDGFYEWRRHGSGKQPYFIRSRDGEPLALAGLWEQWRDADDAALETFTILTCPPSAEVAPMHDRMPVVVGRADFDLWLDPAQQAVERIAPLLRPLADGLLAAWPVSRRVNRPEFDDAACLERVPEEREEDGTLWA